MNRISGQAGFSITELLMAIIIISVGVVGFASAVGLASTELWIGRRDTEVALLVTDQLEELKSRDYAAVVPGARTVGDYQLAWDVQGTDRKKVILVATYYGSNGSVLVDTFVTYISQ